MDSDSDTPGRKETIPARLLFCWRLSIAAGKMLGRALAGGPFAGPEEGEGRSADLRPAIWWTRAVVDVRRKT